MNLNHGNYVIQYLILQMPKTSIYLCDGVAILRFATPCDTIGPPDYIRRCSQLFAGAANCAHLRICKIRSAFIPSAYRSRELYKSGGPLYGIKTTV